MNARTIIEVETPKGVFKKLMGGGSVTVDILKHVRRNDALHYRMGYYEKKFGRVTFEADGNVIDRQVPPDLDQRFVQQIYNDLTRGLTKNVLYRTDYYWRVQGTDPDQDEYAGQQKIRHFRSNEKPYLIVTTPHWTIKGELIKTEWGDYGWRFTPIQPLDQQQRKFMEDHGETIWYSMAEGHEFEDDIRDYDDEVVGRWTVTGNPELAPEVQAETWGYWT